MGKLGSLIRSIWLRLRSEPTTPSTTAMIHFYRSYPLNEDRETPDCGKEIDEAH